MRDFKKRHGEAMVHLAIWPLACVSFLTTTAGILSLAPPVDQDPIRTSFWVAIGILLGGGIAIGIACLALKVYHRVTIPALLSSVLLALVAALFDSSFYQREYAPQLEASTHDRIDEEYRRSEYDRLAREMATSIATVRRQLEPRRNEASQGEREAMEGARYEEKLRPEEPMRYCGPICKDHLRQAARYRAQLDEVQHVESLVEQAPTAPSSDSWKDLERFHAAMLHVLRQLPFDLALPAAPAKPRLLTAGGNAEGIGGLGVIIEMLLAGNFRDVKLALPLALALISELCPIMLVLGARPWKPFRVWFCEKLEHAEEMVDRLPAPGPLALLALTRLVRNDPEMRGRRMARNRRQQEHEDLRREFQTFEDEAALRSEAQSSWSRVGQVLSGGNGHHATEHGPADKEAQ